MKPLSLVDELLVCANNLAARANRLDPMNSWLVLELQYENPSPNYDVTITVLTSCFSSR